MRIAANLDTKTYDLYFGPRGGSLTRITPPTGVAFIKGTGGSQISYAAGASFFTSQKLEPAGDLYIDNVTVTSSVEAPGTIAQAKLLPGSVQHKEDNR